MVDETENFEDLALDDILSEAKEGAPEEAVDISLPEENHSEVVSEAASGSKDRPFDETDAFPEEDSYLVSATDHMGEDSKNPTFDSSEEDNSETFSYQESLPEEHITSETSSPSEVYPISSDNSVGNIGNLRWYSGTSADKVFTISKGFESGEFVADEECKTIHVNVGYDTYGWEVQFSNGIVMNLRDVREYQLRNGKLPAENGRIVYGNNELTFAAVKRIVVYQSVKYFSYGV